MLIVYNYIYVYIEIDNFIQIYINDDKIALNSFVINSRTSHPNCIFYKCFIHDVYGYIQQGKKYMKRVNIY